MKNNKINQSSKANLKLYVITISLAVQIISIISTYIEREYFAIGGEWLVLPLIALIAYGLVPSIQQLIQKDKQIVKQQEQIEHLQRLLENQQILTLKAQEKVQLLESKEEIIEESKEKNKSLWQKIFKKDRR
jgi:hypothetical protein